MGSSSNNFIFEFGICESGFIVKKRRYSTI
jgi:hypothetical protein